MKKTVVLATASLAVMTACGPSVAELKEKANAGDNAALVAWGNSGDPEGMYELAQAYLEGSRVNFNSDSAIILLEQAAAKKYPQALGTLGDFHYNDQWVEADPDVAFKMYGDLAETGDAYGQYMLANCYFYAYGTDENAAAGVANLEKATAQGYDDAKHDLAGIYMDGTGNIPANPEKGMRLYRELAEAGDAGAMCSLGHYLINHDPSGANDAEAFRWFSKAAEKDHDMSIYNMGWCYETGRGIEKNINTAKELYQRAAGMGNSNAAAAIQRLTPKIFNVAGHRYQGKTKYATDFGGITHNTELYFYHSGSYSATKGGGINNLYENGVYRQDGNNIHITRNDGSKGTLTVKDDGSTLTGTISRNESGTLTLVK